MLDYIVNGTLMFFNCFRIRSTPEAPASASTTSPAETAARYGIAQASHSRVNPHADQSAMAEASNQPAVLP